MTPRNRINTWRQGKFIEGRHSRMREELKRQRMSEEALLVRPGPTDNAICRATHPEDAEWIASRLNLAAELETLAYDFAAGKDNGAALVAYVQKRLTAI